MQASFENLLDTAGRSRTPPPSTAPTTARASSEEAPTAITRLTSSSSAEAASLTDRKKVYDAHSLRNGDGHGALDPEPSARGVEEGDKNRSEGDKTVLHVEEHHAVHEADAEPLAPPSPHSFESLLLSLLMLLFSVKMVYTAIDYAHKNYFFLLPELRDGAPSFQRFAPLLFPLRDGADTQLIGFVRSLPLLFVFFSLVAAVLLLLRLRRLVPSRRTLPPSLAAPLANHPHRGGTDTSGSASVPSPSDSPYQIFYEAYVRDAAPQRSTTAPPQVPAAKGNDAAEAHPADISPRARADPAAAVAVVFFGLFFCAYMHGTHVVFFLAVLALNYLVFHVVLARLLRAAPPRHRAGLYFAAVWATHIGLLYLCERTEGFQNSVWMQTYFPSSPEQSLRVTGVRRRPWFGIRQRMRWTLVLRMSTLRMISFLYDGHEARAAAATAEGPLATRHALLERHLRTCLECAELREHYRAFVRPQLAAIHRETAAPAADTVDSGDDGSTDKDSGSVDMTPAYLEAELPECCWCYKLRTACPRPTNTNTTTTTNNSNSSGSDYTFLYYMAYLLFPPLYLAGPMMSYNSFVSYLQTPHLSTVQLDLWCRGWLRRTFRGLRAGSAAATKLAASTGTSTGHLSARRYVREAAVYLLRFAFILFCIQLLLHTAFLPAAVAYTRYLSLQLPSLQAFILYMYLGHLWLRFSLIWKFSRFFSLYAYGIDAPEDMRRCYSNTLSVRDFWRDWHASFNLWIVRYMYVPLGGSRRKLLSVAPIFFFIALWHDHALHLLHWALCIVVVFVAEMVVSSSFAGLLQRPVAAELARLRAADSRSRDGARHDGGDEGTPQPPARPFVRRVAGAIHRYEVRGSSPTREVRRRRRAHLQLLYRLCVRNVGGMATVLGLILANLIGFCASGGTPDTAADLRAFRDKLKVQAADPYARAWMGMYFDANIGRRLEPLPLPTAANYSVYENPYVVTALQRLDLLLARSSSKKTRGSVLDSLAAMLDQVSPRFIVSVCAFIYLIGALGGLQRDRCAYAERKRREEMFGCTNVHPSDHGEKDVL